MIYFNLAQKPLDDPKVRQAINMALDRDELIAGVADGEGEPAWLPVPEGALGVRRERTSTPGRTTSPRPSS